MKPLRMNDLAYRAIINIFYYHRGPLAPEAYVELVRFLNEEAKARGFEDFEDAFKNFLLSNDGHNEATPFDELVKERAIAIRGLRKIERKAHELHTDEEAKMDERILAEEFCNLAHNTLDEIGDDRGSELE